MREAARLGPYRLAIIPIGAWLPRDIMQNSHVGPEEALRIFRALNPAMALAVHWGTFQLAFETIDEPPDTLRGAGAADRSAARSLPRGRDRSLVQRSGTMSRSAFGRIR